MFKIHFLNTVWSDAIILEKDGHFAFIDTASGFYYPMIDEYCKKNNIKNLDFILLTHFHSDHYTNIKSLLTDHAVKTLYFREYTNAEAVGGSGEEATEEYNAKEKAKSDDIMAYAKDKTNLVLLDGSITQINFQGMNLDLINPTPWPKVFYNDEKSPLYHVRRYSENNNSVAVFIHENNHSVLLAGDLTDGISEYQELNRVLSTGVKEMYEKYHIHKIDIYKSAHHGGPGNNNLELIQLINASHIVITNTDKWLDNWSTIPNMKEVNPNVNIYKTDYHIHVFDLTNEQITLEKIPQTSLFITLGKD